MKNLYLFLLIYLSSASIGFGQTMVWTDPIPITDSLTNNINVNMPGMFMYNADTTIYAVWEKSVDASSTAIYGRNILTMSAPFLILSQPNVHFRHPRVFNWASGDTILLVLYETDQNGNWDIYYSKYLKNGTLSPPVPVCNSSADEKNFSYRDGFGISWEQDGAIMFRNFVINGYPAPPTTTTLDQGNCHNPALSADICSWQKVVGTDTTVMTASYLYSSSSWSAPSLVTGGVNENLSCGSDEQNQLLAWQAKEGNKWRIKFTDLSLMNYFFVNDFPGANNISPDFMTAIIVAKGEPLSNFGFFSFASDITGNYEIYVNRDLWDTVNINISNHATMNLHPRFYVSFGYNPGYETVFLTWESYRNHHLQIWMSHLDIPMGIDKFPGLRSAQVENYPNPFSQTTTIRYEIASRGQVSISIFNIMGIKVRELKEGVDDRGKHELSWDGKDDTGARLDPGIYICTVKSGENIVCHRIGVL